MGKRSKIAGSLQPREPRSPAPCGTQAHRGSRRTGRRAGAPARRQGPRTAGPAGPSGRRGCGTGRRGPAGRARPAPARPPPGTAGRMPRPRSEGGEPRPPEGFPAPQALTAFCRSASPFLRAPGGRRKATGLCTGIEQPNRRHTVLGARGPGSGHPRGEEARDRARPGAVPRGGVTGAGHAA